MTTHFSLAASSQRQAILALYHSLAGQPGCTWGEYYPTLAHIDGDIQRRSLFCLTDQAGNLAAVASAGPLGELEGEDIPWNPRIHMPCELARVGVRADCQGLGLAAQLLLQVVAHVQGQGYDGMRLLVAQDNLAAQSLYRRLGFRHIGPIRLYDRDFIAQDWLFDTLLSQDKAVRRQGDRVYRPGKPWSASVQHYLHYLVQAGFPAPQPLGFAPDGREMLRYVPGAFIHPKPWGDEALVQVARLIRRLHDISRAYIPPEDARWQPWFLHGLGQDRLISHGDIAPWNLVTTPEGLPQALIDWEYGGPVDPLYELARACWLFPQLHGDDVAALQGLPPFKARAGQVRLMADAYGLDSAQRSGLAQHILDVMVLETAQEAIDQAIGPESAGPQWGLAWRARSAGMIVRHRDTLMAALN